MFRLILCTLAISPALAASCALAQTATLPEVQSAVPADINKRFLDPDLKPEEWTNRFEIESREVFASRKEIVAALGLKPGARIADVGAGTGLFLRPFSEAVTDTGRVFALDISPRLIEHIKQRVAKDRLKNVEVVLSKEVSLELPTHSVDAVFVCDTYHHFEFYEEMLRSIHQSLRPGGELVVIDFMRIEGVTREWLMGHVRAGEKQVRAEIEKVGFEFVEKKTIPTLKENYFLRFKKP